MQDALDWPEINNEKSDMQQTSIAKRPLWARIVGNDSPILRLLVIAILIFIAFSIVLPDKFPTVRNLQSMAVQFPEYGILALAIMVTMITGGIDLSVVSTANLSAILVSMTLLRLSGGDSNAAPTTLAFVAAIVVALMVGSLCGIFNGFLVARIGIPPILATLGTLSLYQGFSYVISGGPAILTTQLEFLGGGAFLGVPLPVIVFAVLAIIFGVVLGRTTFGCQVYMYGTNARAAKFSGIDSNSVLIRTYWLAGVTAAVAGIVFLARTNSAKADYGESFVLLTVLISILGGVSYSGGFGTVSGVVLAVLCLQFLSTGLNMLTLALSGSSGSQFFRQFAWGALLLLVMVANYYSEQRKIRPRAE
jgi:simple sugar transport system permease protein